MEEYHSIGRKSFHWKEIIPMEGNHSNTSGPHAGPLLISPTIQVTFSRQLKCSKGMKKNIFQCRILKNITGSKSFHREEIIRIKDYHSDGRISFHWKEIIPMEENHSIGRKSFHWKEIIPIQVAPMLAPSLYPQPSKEHFQDS